MAGRIFMDASPPAAQPQSTRNSSPQATPIVRSVVGCALIMTAIGVAAVWIYAHNAQRIADEKRTKAREDIELVLGALEAFREANGKYPDSLGALWVPDSRGFTYLDPKHPPKDPWNIGYQYAPPGPGETRPRVWTFGRDRREGGDGESVDVKSWEEKR